MVRKLHGDDFRNASTAASWAAHSQTQAAGVLGGVGSVLGGFAASGRSTRSGERELQSMQTLFLPNELEEKKLTDATSNEPQMPSAVLLYALGRRRTAMTTTASSSSPSGRRSSAPTSALGWC